MRRIPYVVRDSMAASFAGVAGDHKGRPYIGILFMHHVSKHSLCPEQRWRSSPLSNGLPLRLRGIRGYHKLDGNHSCRNTHALIERGCHETLPLISHRITRRRRSYDAIALIMLSYASCRHRLRTKPLCRTPRRSDGGGAIRSGGGPLLSVKTRS